MNDTGRTLWHGIVAAYAAPGVAPLCLRLQQEGDVDVPLLLVAAHAAGPLAAPLSAAEARTLRRLTRPWRDAAVLPARALRIALRDAVVAVPDTRREAFRDRVKALELEAERQEILLIAEWLEARVADAPSDPLEGLRTIAGSAIATDAELRTLVAAFAD